MTGEAVGEVVPLEEARHGHRAGEPHGVGIRQLAEPFAVEAHLRLLAVEDPERLLGEELGVRVEQGVVQHRPFLREPGGVTDPSGVVADDEDADVPLVLERPHALEGDPIAESRLWCRDVDAQLHAQGPAEFQLRLEAARGKHVDGVACQLCNSHASESRSGARGTASRRGRSATAARPRA